MRWRTFTRGLSRALLPACLVLCVVLGGASAPGQMWHLGLQVGACVIALSAVWFLRSEAWRAAGTALVLFAVAVGVGLLQLVPVPPLAAFSGASEALVREGRALLGLGAPPMEPTSLAPLRTLEALPGFLPPLAMLLLALALGRRRTFDGVRWLIPVLAAGGAAYGLAQVYSGGDPEMYLHDITNLKLPVGTFANVNHQACFLLMCLPFAMALAGRARQSWQGFDRDFGRAALIAGLMAFGLVGVLAAGSTAGYLLLVPTALASILLVRRGRGEGGNRVLFSVMLLGIVASAVLVGFSPVLPALGMTDFGDGDLSRRYIWEATTRMIAEHWVTGVGLGSFPDVVPIYEQPTVITRTFVNHAHSDYQEVIAEMGLLGAALLVAALAVWLGLGWRVWSRRIDDEYRLRRAAWISLMVPVLHSLVDYPLRTPAVAVLAAVCLAIILMPVGQQSGRKGRPAGTEKRLEL